MSDDRRSEFRRNAFTFGLVETGEREAGCLVWDLNETGAMIELEEPGELPERFRLRPTREGEAREAVVAWRRGSRVGISFAD